LKVTYRDYVLAFSKPLYGGHSLIGLLLKAIGLHNAATNFYLPSILYNMFAVVVTLAAIQLSGDPWPAFGIKKPTALDLFTGRILIPRLERLLRSTWASVLVSAAVFWLLYWGNGILSMCHAFLGGIVYGIAFAWTRRLWPVAIAHAAHDFPLFYGTQTRFRVAISRAFSNRLVAKNAAYRPLPGGV
jgi:hypothetical protein